MAYKLVEATDAHMTRPQLGLPRGIHFYPSEASADWIDHHGVKRVAGTCMRQAWYRCTGTKTVGQADAYSEWIFALGKAVECILVEQWKQMGIWVANNVKFYEEKHNVSGELDVVLSEPDGTLFGVECKSFYGYQATRDIIGNKHITGKPKTSQLLQTLVYVDLCRRLGIIQYFKMIYYARDSAARKEFDIALIQDGEHLRPTIDGVIDYRFTIQDIYDRYDQLAAHIKNNDLPPRDFGLVWDNEKVEERRALGEVSDTAYKDWQKKPDKNPIGDWQCRYCPYAQVCYGGK
jgi:CRISPR/Cas system-associated exonuclease Cas4 (RecB family)